MNNRFNPRFGSLAMALALAGTLAAGPTVAQVAPPPEESSGGGGVAPVGDERGAVLCSYAFVVSVRAFQGECRPDDSVARTALDSLRIAHRDFVGRNQPATLSQLDAFERENNPFEGAEEGLCADEHLSKLYAEFKDNMDDYEEDISTSLSVDREPVWDPCL